MNFIKRYKGISLLGAVLLVISIILFVIGIAVRSQKSCVNEIKSNKFVDFLTKVKREYYDFYPQETVYDPEATFQSIIDNFTPYDPKPSSLKAKTDRALSLKNELTNLKLDVTKLKPREKKAFAQVEHFLESIFGNPFDGNYYAGVWMMGPNYFCWQPICNIGSNLKDHFSFDFSPKTEIDLKKIVNTIQNHKSILTQYKDNLIYGIQAGMVRSVDDCKAGINAFKQKFPKTVEKGPNGKKSNFIENNLFVVYTFYSFLVKLMIDMFEKDDMICL